MLNRWAQGIFVAISITGAVTPAALAAPQVYVIDSNVSAYVQVQAAKSHLSSLGYSLTSGGTLADYSAYDQVWDLRYGGNLSAADVSAMGAYLGGGGRMYLTGENAWYDSLRNTSLVNFISAVGGGALTLADGYASGAQPITPNGQVVNGPNTFTAVDFAAARTTSTAGNGFLVTETASGSGSGSLVAWSFGDLEGAPLARMLVGFDIQIFTNGPDWTENMAAYLGQAATVIPLPPALAFYGASVVLLGLFGIRGQRSS